MSQRERYVLTAERDEEGRITAVRLSRTELDGEERTIRVNSVRLPRVVGPLHDVVRAGGVTGRQWSSSRPLELDQVTGAHAHLLLSAVRPVRRALRVEQIAEGVAQMSREEASYWHAKSHRRGGLAALRTLLAAAR